MDESMKIETPAAPKPGVPVGTFLFTHSERFKRLAPETQADLVANIAANPEAPGWAFARGAVGSGVSMPLATLVADMDMAQATVITGTLTQRDSADEAAERNS